MPEFSETTQKLLKRAGWFPGRRVDIAKYEQAMIDAKIQLFDHVRNFWSEFGGLHVQTLKAGRDFLVDPLVAAKNFHIDYEGLSDYSNTVGSLLCCIGVASRAQMMLLMDQTGRVFAVIDDLIYLAGESPHAALEALCTGEPLREYSSDEASLT